MTVKHFKATVRRTDFPDDPPDTVDERSAEWNIYSLAEGLRRRYGPTVEADVEIDGKRWRVTGSVIASVGETP